MIGPEPVRTAMLRLTALLLVLAPLVHPAFAAEDAASAESGTRLLRVSENAPAGTLVGTLGVDHVLFHAIVAGDDEGAFAIDVASGEIRVRRSAALDHETRPIVELAIEVVAGWPADDDASWRYVARLLQRTRDLSAVVERRRTMVRVEVTDVDEPPVVGTRRIDTTVVPGEDVAGRISVLDPEEGDPADVRIVGETPFTIDATGVLRWKGGRGVGPLEAESHRLHVEAVDSAGSIGSGLVDVVVHPSFAGLDETVEVVRTARELGGALLDEGLAWSPWHRAPRPLDPGFPGDAATPGGGVASGALAVLPPTKGASRPVDPGNTSAEADAAGDWSMLLALSGSCVCLLASCLLGRRRLRSVQNEQDERCRLLAEEGERCRALSNEAEAARAEALRTSERLRGERDDLQSERDALEAELRNLGEQIERTRHAAAASCVATAAAPSRGRSSVWVDDDPFVDRENSDSATGLSGPVFLDRATCVEHDDEFLDFTDASGADAGPCGVDPFDAVHTDILDSNDCPESDEATEQDESGKEAKRSATEPSAGLRAYLAAQFGISGSAEAPPAGTGRSLADSTGPAKRTEAKAKPPIAPERLVAHDGRSAGDTREKPSGPRAPAAAAAPAPAPAPAPTARPRDEKPEEGDKYSSVEAYMSRLLGKPAQPVTERVASSREPSTTDRQVQRLAVITETEREPARERRSRRRPTAEGEEVDPNAPIHTVDKDGERERIRSLRSVANDATQEALDAFRKRIRTRQVKLLVILAGLLVVGGGVAWYVFVR